MAPPRPNKKDVMLALLEQSGVFVHLDPRIQGVVVPDGFRRQPELVLQFGLNMAVPIKDLDVDDEAVSGTLSFARRPFWVKVPWSAIYALVSDEDHRGMVWPEDAPRESKLSQGAPRATEKPRPKLRAVGPDEPAPEPEVSSDEDHEDDERDGVCAQCSTPWLGGGSHCAVCGASRREAFRAEGEAGEGEAGSDGEDAGDGGLGLIAPAAGPSQARKRPTFSVVSPPAESSTRDDATADGARSDGSNEPEPAPEEPLGDEPGGGAKAKKRPSHLRLVK
jgi:stringent starvation protein B